MPSVTGVAHLSFTVRNLRVSERWYRELFGWDRVYAEREAHFDSVVLQDPASLMVVSLRQRHGGSTARFDESRTGLDHVSFGVAGRHELEAWATRLSELRIEHAPITETAYGSVLVFRDPDHIQMEFFCRSPHAPRPARSEGGTEADGSPALEVRTSRSSEPAQPAAAGGVQEPAAAGGVEEPAAAGGVEEPVATARANEPARRLIPSGAIARGLHPRRQPAGAAS